LKPDFNLLDGFRMLDFTAKGYLSPIELVESLEKILRIDSITQNDIYLFFRRYDPTSSGRFTFHEYCNAVSPLTKEYTTLL
jgi:Ca2+-binding EF-hand superfamily protein